MDLSAETAEAELSLLDAEKEERLEADTPEHAKTHWTLCNLLGCRTHLDADIHEKYETNSAPELDEETGLWEIFDGVWAWKYDEADAVRIILIKIMDREQP